MPQFPPPAALRDLAARLSGELRLDVANARVRVQPGVVRNDLNRFLAAHGLFFAPDFTTFFGEIDVYAE